MLNLLEITVAEDKPREGPPKETSAPHLADLTMGPGTRLLVYGAEPLTDEEIQVFEQMEELGGTYLRRTPEAMRHSHHEAARLVASGMNSTQISVLTGMRPQTLAGLRRAPAFQELIQHYADLRAKEIVSLSERMKVIALDGLQQLHEKVVDPEATPSFVLKATEAMLDRSGFGQGKKVELTGVHTHVLSGIKERNAESVVVERAAALPAPQNSGEGGEGFVDVESSPVGQNSEVAGSEGGGTKV